MNQPNVITTVDTTGIQPYIFGSNRLRENIGASGLVKDVTEDWPEKIIEEHQEWGDPLFNSGGGNIVLFFHSLADAKSFARAYSEKLLTEAPGLNVVIHHYEVDPNETFREAMKAAGEELRQKKGHRPVSAPLLGLGVTAACDSTGMPAITFDSFYAKKSDHNSQVRFRPIANELIAKLDEENRQKVRADLERLIPAIKEARFDFWYDPEKGDRDLEDDDSGSYIAVVHADGNDMGRRFLAISEHAPSEEAAKATIKKLSDLVDDASRSILRKLGVKLVLAWDGETSLLADEIRIHDYVMPFRPLVYGGDDVTFLCEGRLGITLAALYLELFEDEMAAHLALEENEDIQSLLEKADPSLKNFYACAGVAVVKTHYPFARAYQLAEDLCANAKRYVRKQKQLGKTDGFSALDWHFATGGLYGGIEEIRKREFTARFLVDNDTLSRNLQMRPVRLRPHEDDWRTWPNFAKVLESFKTDDKWRGRRNKIIQLREALRQGPKAVKDYRLAYGLQELPTAYGLSSRLHEDGWGDEEHCGYFDAIEALDFYVPLENEQTESPAQISAGEG